MIIDSFYPYVKQFEQWRDGFPGVKDETREFLENLLNPNRKKRLWTHQIRAVERVIFAYEVLEKKNVLLNIVTGGGKTAIIAAVMAWLKYSHGISKFLVLVPNTVVKDRLEKDFQAAKIFSDFQLFPPGDEQIVNQLGLFVLGAGAAPQGMLESGVILGNIQQFYQANISGQRNLAYILNYIGDIAVFNDEAHNTPAPEYSQVLSTLSPKCKFRMDTTATPDRADGQSPDSEMIYYYDIANALEDHIIKSVVVYEPEVRLVELTYTNFATGERRKVTELDEEFAQAEEHVRPFQWILDPEPMKKQMSIALARLEEQRKRAKGRYKPLLFVVTMSINEAEKAKLILEETFKLRTLLVTEESDEEERKEAQTIGSIDSEYDAVVSVLMLREGWDVPEVSTILLLRKFSSPVYGQQVIGRGLRRIIRDEPEAEILAVVDHPKLEHDWLWRLVAVSKIRQGVLPEDMFGDEDLPIRPKIQRLAKPENLIAIPEPEYEEKVDFKEIEHSIPDDATIKDWREALDAVTYDRNAWEITRTKIGRVKGKHLESRKMDVLDAESEAFQNRGQEVEKTREDLEEDLKREVMNLAGGLLLEAGYGGLKKGMLYNAMMDHINKKVLRGKRLSQADQGDIEFALYVMPQIRRNFTKGIISGILEK